MTVKQRYVAVCQHIAALNSLHDSSCTPTSLLAVSKGQSVDVISELVDLGQVHFGENYVQEAVPKIESLRSCDLDWHFIGRRQSNKLDSIARHFSWVDSLSSVKHAEKLNAARASYGIPINVCLQVKLSDNDKKSGLTEAELLPVVREMSKFPFVRLRGFMTMCAQHDSVSQRRQQYMKLSKLRDQAVGGGVDLDTLSMGMSDDYELAINAGATVVRVGTGIFGPRYGVVRDGEV